MKLSRRCVLLATGASLLGGLGSMAGCRTTEDRAELIVTPTIGSSTGDIAGYVVVVNDVQQRLGDKGGVFVTVEGSAVGSVTNALGAYTLKQLEPGTYTVTWTKPDFGFSRRSGVVCREGVVAPGPKMWIVEIPQFNVQGLGAAVTAASVTMTGQITGDTHGASPTIRFFVGHAADVNAGPRGYFYTEVGSIPALEPPTARGVPESSRRGTGVFSLPLDLPTLLAAGGTSGAAVYVVAHADGVPAQSYDDLNTGGKVFTTINPVPSNVIRVVLP